MGHAGRGDRCCPGRRVPQRAHGGAAAGATKRLKGRKGLSPRQLVWLVLTQNALKPGALAAPVAVIMMGDPLVSIAVGLL